MVYEGIERLDRETYIHTTNDDDHVATASQSHDRSIFFDQCSDPVCNTNVMQKLSHPDYHAVKTNRKYNTYCFFGNGFSQNHVAGGPGGRGTPYLCVGAVAKTVLERRSSIVMAAALPARYVQGMIVMAIPMPFPSRCIVPGG